MPKRAREPGLGDDLEGMDTTNKKQLTSQAKTPPKRKSSAVTTPGGKKTKKLEPFKRRKLVVGLDYGTTFTGLAFVMTGETDARDILVISDWSGAVRRSEEVEKVPSCIAYAAEHEGLDDDVFGYDVEPHMKSYHWTKLLLDRGADLTEYDNPHLYTQSGQGLLRLPAGKAATEVAADVLRFVYKHAMEKFDKYYGQDIMKVTNIECWLTVPATWTGAAIDETTEAAKAAGFGSRPEDTVNIITEPEAAAIAILSSSIEKNPGLYKKNMTILVVDMGGGTVDLQSLTITNLSPLHTDEVCEGEGGKTGSTYIDCNLHHWMTETFGEAFAKMPAGKVGPNSKFMSAWELVKKSFTGKTPDKVYRLSFQALRKALEDAKISPTSYDFDDHEVLITGADIMAMFNPVIEKTIALIESQRTKLKRYQAQPFQVIALCGGLGGSEYVWQKLQQHCTSKLKGNVQLVTDERAWSSIARGAATRGLGDSIVIAKRSKKYYGIAVHQAFEPGVDQEEDAFICPVLGTKRARGYVHFAVKKGQKFTKNSQTPTKVYAPISLDDLEESMSFTWDLYSCSTDEAPNRIDAAGVKYEAEIHLDLSRAFHKSSVQDASTDVKAVPAMVNIVFKLGQDKGVLVVEARHESKVVGTAKLDWSKSQARRVAQPAGLM